MSDYEISEQSCPKCKHGFTHRRACTEIDCDDGRYHDCGEDCCMCRYPEPNRRCEECQGRGVFVWCPNCGLDLLQNRFINGRDQREVKAAEK